MRAMLLGEILRQPVFEMSYPRKKADILITGRERPINDHLLKLLAVPPGPARDRNLAHWMKELVAWLGEIGEMRLKPHARRLPRGFCYRILFDEPFGGNEAGAVAGRLRLLAIGPDALPVRGDLDPAEAAGRLRAFHEAFDAGCAAGRQTVEAAEAMVQAFAAGG